MLNLSLEDYKKLNFFIEKKSIHLMNHEKKEYSQTSFPISNYMLFPINGKSYYRIATNIFMRIVDDSILKIATEKHPELFGTGNSKDIITAIHSATEEILPEIFSIYKNRLEDFKGLIQKAHCYIIEFYDNDINSRILRIDLFRKIDRNQKNSEKTEFTGGLFHSFKHFSVNKINLSIGTEIVELFHPIRMIDYIATAFYRAVKEDETEKGYTTVVEFDGNHNLFFSFYKEENTGIYFLNTAYKKK